ncbi:Monooxygenase FAD-binding protein [Macrophomina phaseolina MS6]|uniref:Monooxygenase FAD-binding protein n=1 Tax=Macrophomina phaseolina (strain MS6) TaxID=1126212 RepID=K2RVU2_MACPH|nr:Monooxygenase FAD-binding protein [Macrophomina phaseolina MS6]
MAALWMAKCGIDVRIVDKRATKVFKGQADSLQARTIEILDSFGIAEVIYKRGAHLLETSFWARSSFDFLLGRQLADAVRRRPPERPARSSPSGPFPSTIQGSAASTRSSLIRVSLPTCALRHWPSLTNIRRPNRARSARRHQGMRQRASRARRGASEPAHRRAERRKSASEPSPPDAPASDRRRDGRGAERARSRAGRFRHQSRRRKRPAAEHHRQGGNGRGGPRKVRHRLRRGAQLDSRAGRDQACWAKQGSSVWGCGHHSYQRLP